MEQVQSTALRSDQPTLRTAAYTALQTFRTESKDQYSHLSINLRQSLSPRKCVTIFSSQHKFSTVPLVPVVNSYDHFAIHQNTIHNSVASSEQSARFLQDSVGYRTLHVLFKRSCGEFSLQSTDRRRQEVLAAERTDEILLRESKRCCKITGVGTSS